MKRAIHITILFCAVFFCAELGYGQKGEHKRQVSLQAYIPLDSSQDFCNWLYHRGHSYFQTGYPENDRKGYDTLRIFIESCANLAHVADCGEPWRAFDEVTGDAQGMSTDNNKWLEYRDWLKKVLYYNTKDMMYYCEDARAMLSTFNYLIPGKGRDYNGEIAIIDFLLSTNRCPTEAKSLMDLRNYIRTDFQIQHWRDTVKDSIATPLDTFSVTIDQIGFSILRGQNGVVANKNNIHGLGNLIATKNPFSDATTLGTVIGDAMMLKLEIFDVLGRQLYSENRFFSEGDVKWNLDGKGLPVGSLYVRVSSIGGEVKSVKLVHEK